MANEASALSGTTAPHAQEVEAFLEAVKTGPQGLTEQEAARRLAEHGPNKLPEQAKKSALLRILEQLANPLVVTLLVAAGIAIFVGFTAAAHESFLSRFGDAIAILLIVVLNAFLGYYQERRAEAALEALQKLSAPSARVRRSGKIMVIPAEELVPGDLLELEAGDAIPSDARLVQTIDLATEEAALTGESTSLQKDAAALCAVDAPLADRATMVFLGTTIVRGKGRAVVTGTGVGTELGKIGQMIAQVGEQKTPLEERLDQFGGQILRVCLALSAVLLAWGYARGKLGIGAPRPIHELLLEAVSLAVAAIPEGLPAITTITLALGMQRMAKRGAIVRKLPAVETLGAATIIASDKTGTLTQNEMTVRALWSGGQRYTVTGEGYDPKGQFLDEAQREVESFERPLTYLLQTAALCNNAELQMNPETGRIKVVGDPTEGALLTLAAKADLARESVLPQHGEVVHELPFDSDRKRMTVITRDAEGREIAHVKGSVDVLLPRCARIAMKGGSQELTDELREQITAEADRLSMQALRVLAMCSRVIVHRKGGSDDDIERELKFLGLVGMMDPPRAGVREAVETCTRAGIRAVMITGDHKLTATAIAKEISLWAPGDRAITGHELAQMSDPELVKEVMHLRVFARTTAEQKLRIVRAFKAEGTWWP
jgi:Ca2+-transporting ATPase